MGIAPFSASSEPTGEHLAEIHDIDAARASLGEGIVEIETCLSRWLFDENVGLFACLPLSAPDTAAVWRRFDHLVIAPEGDHFIVFLDSSGTRLLRSRRHRTPCPRCGGGSRQRGSTSGPRRVVRG
jgi:hypothetical protein